MLEYLKCFWKWNFVNPPMLEVAHKRSWVISGALTRGAVIHLFVGRNQLEHFASYLVVHIGTWRNHFWKNILETFIWVVGYCPRFLLKNGLNHRQKTIQIHPWEPSFNCTAKAEFQPPEVGKMFCGFRISNELVAFFGLGDILSYQLFNWKYDFYIYIFHHILSINHENSKEFSFWDE